MHNFETEFLFFLRKNHADLLGNLRQGKLLDADLETLRKVAEDIAAKYEVKK